MQPEIVPCGQEYKKLAAQFWRSLLSITEKEDSLPEIENTFFLRSNTEGEQLFEIDKPKSITVPANYSLFIPCLTFMLDSYNDPSRNKRRNELNKLINNPEELTVSIDEQSFGTNNGLCEVKNVEDDEFAICIPSNSYLADKFDSAHPLPKGEGVIAAQAGYFLLVKPPNEVKTIKIIIRGKSKKMGQGESESHHEMKQFETQGAFEINYVAPTTNA